MIKTEKLVSLKRNSRNKLSVVREHYIRKDIPCKSSLCNSCVQPTGIHRLPTDTTHYVIPDCKAAKQYLEIFELKELTGVIFLQTVYTFLQQSCGSKTQKKVKEMVNNPCKGCAVFNNEFHQDCYQMRQPRETLDQWRGRNIRAACNWYHQHLEQTQPIILVTDDEDVIRKYGCEVPGVFFLTMSDYLAGFWPDLTEASDLLESLQLSGGEANLNVGAAICKEFQEYYSDHVLQAGIKSGRFISNYLKVNKHKPVSEAFVQNGNDNKEGSRPSDILIHGTAYRNRAMDGDLVVVEILPKHQWQCKSSAISDSSNNEGTGDQVVEGSGTEAMISGRVVGVLQRNSRDFVVALQENTSDRNRSEKVLTIPWDRRIPKIRITTRQINRLLDQRFIVRIDSWETSSLYPNGHFVKSLGRIGDIETEMSTILVEHGLSVGPFSEGILQEMPTNTWDQPWIMEEEEMQRRRDLRSSHLIFSIDPQGCEDVDDTLSVRHLPDGLVELGVHIADVTHFVKPNSLTDLEARNKTTTVYLADRRYDMLPGVLSADLCSLNSGVDRYAVSVIWKLDPSTYEVRDVWYGRTIICSKYKLFYEAAQQIADGDMKVEEAIKIIPELKEVEEEHLTDHFETLRKTIQQLMHVARQLKQQRSQKGAVDLEAAEIQLQLGASKEIKDLTPKQSLEIHETIAECMIFANYWVAKKILDTYSSCSVLRHHPAPKQDHFSNLRDCADAKGFTVDSSTNHALSTSLDSCTDSRDVNVNKVLRMLATQAMQVASYFSTGSLERERFFHYGLALDVYTHFTSPIRRYADVLVHRLLLSSVHDPTTDASALLPNKQLQEICQHINVKHREADHAQKDSMQIFQSLYFKEHSTDEACTVDALVFNIRTNGVLVFVPKYGIKGAVFLKDKVGSVYRPWSDNSVKLTQGVLERITGGITVHYDGGSVDVKLFSYLQVRIEVENSSVHSESLKFTLVSYKPSIKLDANEARVEKHHLIQNVKASETRHNENASTSLHDKAKDKERKELVKKYGQTNKNNSLYHMFESFKQMALLENPG